MRRVVALCLVVAALLAVIALAWRCGRPPAARRGRIAHDAIGSSRVDVAAFRAHLARRRASARILQERHARERRATGDRPRHGFGASLVSPRCILGPADLCASIADAVDDCDGGDGRACIAVGQYLEDAPPRPLIALTFYMAACNEGEQEACDRQATLKSNEPVVDCAADVLACAWRAYRSKDAALLAQACELGVADACVTTIDDEPPARERARLERACQLGNPMTCEALAYRLSPACPLRCAADEYCDFECYPPDLAAAQAAATIACDVGFTSACADVP